jgi:hypothetical protein
MLPNALTHPSRHAPPATMCSGGAWQGTTERRPTATCGQLTLCAGLTCRGTAILAVFPHGPEAHATEFRAFPDFPMRRRRAQAIFLLGNFHAVPMTSYAFLRTFYVVSMWFLCGFYVVSMWFLCGLSNTSCLNTCSFPREIFDQHTRRKKWGSAALYHPGDVQHRRNRAGMPSMLTNPIIVLFKWHAIRWPPWHFGSGLFNFSPPLDC